MMHAAKRAPQGTAGPAKGLIQMEFFDLAGDPAGGFPYSQAVRCNGLVFVAGQLAADEPGFGEGLGDIGAETRMAMQRIGRILAEAGSGFEHVLRVGIFMTDLGEFDGMNAAYRTFFPHGRLPARTCVGVASLLDGCRIEIDCVARVPPADLSR
jgi:2-iminobutanoate/2-iminopropanoate deaminase